MLHTNSYWINIPLEIFIQGIHLRNWESSQIVSGLLVGPFGEICLRRRVKFHNENRG